MIKTFFVIALLFVFVIFFASKIYAHGTAISFSKIVGNYDLEFEYDVPQIVAGETNSYIFRLLDQKTKNAVTFDAALIRFERKSDQATIIVARVTQDELQDGVARLTAMLDQGGYTVTSSFYKGDTKVAEANFDLTVQKSDTSNTFPVIPFVAGVAGAVLGFVIGRFAVGGARKND